MKGLLGKPAYSEQVFEYRSHTHSRYDYNMYSFCVLKCSSGGYIVECRDFFLMVVIIMIMQMQMQTPE